MTTGHLFSISRLLMISHAYCRIDSLVTRFIDELRTAKAEGKEWARGDQTATFTPAEASKASKTFTLSRAFDRFKTESGVGASEWDNV